MFLFLRSFFVVDAVNGWLNDELFKFFHWNWIPSLSYSSDIAFYFIFDLNSLMIQYIDSRPISFICRIDKFDENSWFDFRAHQLIDDGKYLCILQGLDAIVDFD